MAGQGLKQWIAMSMCAWLLPWSQPSVAREPPADGCIDLHNITGGWRIGEREILIRSNGQAGARLELDPACPVFVEGVDLETLAPEGWACPSGRLFVRGGENTCPVIQMSTLSASELADALRMRGANMQPSVTLDRVEVQGRHWRDIGGTTDYCVDARFLRGWHKDREGLVVEVSPRRHAGHRYYRVETVNICSDLATAHSIRLVSRNGGAAVCGYPGDKVVLINDSSEGFVQMGGSPTGAFWRGCEISRVTPFARE
ncbi:hypothetical protein [Luteimonas salinilitoris]|uniref:Uncharacterized protein n=1 Tax=Luteimonas salinilitoris TaxID=3237697 RepID=A0ABV4HWG1_9GAMM